MILQHYDVLVVGAGPAGSVAALVLARGGARVALVDKAGFPRDKACGDLIGPRGVRTLDELGLLAEVSAGAVVVGDMDVVGPTGRRVVLRATAGLTYPGYGLAVPRRAFDDRLRTAAAAAGAEVFTGRAGEPCLSSDGELEGFRVEGLDRVDLRADVVIGADGALSRVAEVAGLADPSRIVWGFAVRTYAGEGAIPARPEIRFWEPERWRGYPGYGWVFPGVDGAANVGLGIGVRGDRRAGARASRDAGAFAASLGVGGVASGRGAGGWLGGWLKMGMVGTVPAAGRTLLVGDAAGLVNPLQGEGISQALGSGRAAAEAVLRCGPMDAAAAYRGALAARYAPYAATTAPIMAAMLRRPRVVAAAGRVLTTPGLGWALSGGWSVYWNDLLDGARPGWPRRVAAVADGVARAVTVRSADRREVWAALDQALSSRASKPRTVASTTRSWPHRRSG